MGRCLSVALVLVALTACAQRDQTTYWRDFTTADRRDAQLRQDMAACEHQSYLAAAAGGTLAPGPRAWQSCMESKGWEQVR